MKNNIQTFIHLHQQLLKLVEKMPEAKRNQPLFNKWDLKDILAHLTAWNKLNAYHTQCAQQNQNFKWVADTDEFNKNNIQKAKNKTWEQVINNFNTSAENLINTFKNLPEQSWDKKCGPQNKYSPRIFLQCSIDHYQTEHIPQIHKALKTL